MSLKPYVCPMKKECPEIVIENVRVFLNMSGKCLPFDLKIDQTRCPAFLTSGIYMIFNFQCKKMFGKCVDNFFQYGKHLKYLIPDK